jgi:ubiquitin-conjugating enzyme E2 Q
MQVDKLADKHAESTPSKTCTAEDRVSGMDDYMQFRFAMGAPDKEQRFINCVNEVAARTKSTHPTLFAWHGSPIGNWHSIIREGLHFNDTSHGRAYGHGVYMSPHVSTSLGYSSLSYAGGGSGGASTWPNSELKISSAISLNEVVNAPTEFVSQAPHYVVAQLDYIQTRYLFVTTANDYHTKTPPPSLVYAQDPTRQALGSSNLPVVIPITAVSKSRRPVVETKKLPSGTKKAKTVRVTDQQSAEDAQDDADSVVSDLADREYLDSDMDDYNEPSAVLKEISNGASRKKRPRDPVLPLTDFVPGTLDFSKLQMLQVPQYANPYATKQLSTALRELVKLQNSTKSHELGWYIDSEKIENLYQWIIELHSFDKDLLLASDMKKAGLTSVILEMRFTANFPFSPPFVRVVSPRFLPFLAGGGGKSSFPDSPELLLTLNRPCYCGRCHLYGASHEQWLATNQRHLLGSSTDSHGNQQHRSETSETRKRRRAWSWGIRIICCIRGNRGIQTGLRNAWMGGS